MFIAMMELSNLFFVTIFGSKIRAKGWATIERLGL